MLPAYTVAVMKSKGIVFESDRIINEQPTEAMRGEVRDRVIE
jgi:hypothetical protein